ncbi:MAG: hypothetical protein IMZ71_05605 [Chloroflexi bacterium]|nr:hypothetical protein [Chloroflexota bacterium]
MGTALKDGQCTLEQAFPPIQAEQTGSTADRIKNHFPDTDKKVEVEDLKPEPEVKPEPESTTKAKAEKEKAKLAAAEAKAKAKAEKEKPAPEPEVITEPEPKEEVLPDKWTCLRCDRKLKDDGKDVKGGKCAYCFGEIATL